MIKFDHVSKVYPKNIIALENISLEIIQGEFICLVGRSGAGKSTLLRMITREDSPTDGNIYIEDIDISRIPAKNLSYLRRKIGVVFQDIKLIPSRTAFENVAYAMEASGNSIDEIEKDVPLILDLVGLSEKRDAFPNELSGGEKQRVAIARALAHKPLLFLADEPTGNLDLPNATEIFELLKKINEMGTTVILATHAKALVDKIKKRVVVIEQGQVVSDQEQGKYKL